MVVGYVIAGGVVALAGWFFLRAHVRYRRAEFIRRYAFPAGLFDKLAARGPAALAEVGEVSGVGAKKLEAYGKDILRVLDDVQS